MSNKSRDSQIYALPVLQDNIIWIWIQGNKAVVVDPAIAKPVRDLLVERNLNLISILQTHHHEDHIGGTKGLLTFWPEASVVASKEDIDRIPFQTKSVKDGEVISIFDRELEVFDVKGHTRNHIAYFHPQKDNSGYKPFIFCGDTLFGGGCGRLFEGTPEEMFNSLNKLSRLPPETRVYCSHEYTESNLRWAASVYPEDQLIDIRLKKVIQTRREGKLTLPSNISEESKTNLFLRAKNVEEFASLRRNKDNWKG